MIPMRTKYGYLTKLTTDITPINYMGFDIETIGKTNDFYMGSIVNDDYQDIAYDPGDLLDKMIKRNREIPNLIFCATNLGFDMLSLLKNTIFMRHLRPIFRGGSMISAKWIRKLEDRTKSSHDILRFMDTMNFLPFGVKKLGERIVNIPKLTQPTFLGKRPQTSDEEKYLRDYNIRDAFISYKTMNFVRDFYASIGAQVKNTVAATSMDLWRRQCLDRPIKVISCIGMRSLKMAYFGGRTETYIRGHIKSDFDTDNIYRLYDVVSMYPYVMRKHKYPDPNSIHWSRTNTDRFIREFEGVSFVRIKSPTRLHKPFLPYRYKKRLIFPTGEWSAAYSHLELRHAMKLGYTIKKVIGSIYFTDMFRPFKKFVDYLHPMRKKFKREKNPSEKMVKVTENGLYGKFCQSILGERKIHHSDDIDIGLIDEYIKEGYKETIVGSDNEWRYYDKCNVVDDDVPAFVIPIFGVYVTAHARMKLYDAFDDNTVYCDTDSVVTTTKMKTSTDLGGWDCQAVLKEGIFIRPKFYWYRDDNDKSHLKVKGVRGITEQIFFDYLDGYSDPDKTFNMQKFAGFGMCNRPYQGRFHSYNEIMEIRKRYDLEDTKRIWQKPKFSRHDIQSSVPHLIEDDMTQIDRDIAYNKALTAFDKKRDIEMKQYFDSDLWDSTAVGHDITDQEHFDKEYGDDI